MIVAQSQALHVCHESCSPSNLHFTSNLVYHSQAFLFHHITSHLSFCESTFLRLLHKRDAFQFCSLTVSDAELHQFISTWSCLTAFLQDSDLFDAASLTACPTNPTASRVCQRAVHWALALVCAL